MTKEPFSLPVGSAVPWDGTEFMISMSLCGPTFDEASQVPRL